jgi:hypothetical protein
VRRQMADFACLRLGPALGDLPVYVGASFGDRATVLSRQRADDPGVLADEAGNEGEGVAVCWDSRRRARTRSRASVLAVSERARRPAGRPCAVVDETSKVHVRGPGGDDRASVLSDVCSRTDNGPVRRRRSWRCGLTAIDHRRQSSVRPEEASIPASPRIDVPQARSQTYTPRTSGAEVVPKTSRGPDLPVVAGDSRSRPSGGGEQPDREGTSEDVLGRVPANR